MKTSARISEDASIASTRGTSKNAKDTFTLSIEATRTATSRGLGSGTFTKDYENCKMLSISQKSF